MPYRAPVAEQRFALETSGQIHALSALPAFAGLDDDLIAAIIDESARFTADAVAPTNRDGDTHPATVADGVVTVPASFGPVYRQYAEGGWIGLAAPAAFGGQGLPFVLSAVTQEQLTSANMAFSLCPMLSMGAIEALAAHASPEMQKAWLEPIVSGRWTGTMNLTEPQAGSDVGALRTTATPAADGSWRIAGNKIFITWGEHELTDNIVHLVLARTPGAPAGTRGISLFVVPKFLPDGTRNDLHCASVEHKLGIHASPTCVMSYGDNGNCVGWLVGEENGGMKAMFTMMNHARVNVGLQGVSIAERAWQAASRYAADRVQSARIGHPGGAVPIARHVDVRRMLMTMKSTTEACRALLYANAAAVDLAHATGDPAAQARANLLTPISKSFATDMGVDIASIGVQIHGGMGFIEETGAAQHYRDARIAPIYEGTNGIQAIDLVGRKLAADGGAAWASLMAELEAACAAAPADRLGDGVARVCDALAATDKAARSLITRWQADPEDAAAAATPFQMMAGYAVTGGLMLAQAAEAARRLAAGAGDPAFLEAKLATVRFYAEQIVPRALGYVASVEASGAALRNLDDAVLGVAG